MPRESLGRFLFCTRDVAWVWAPWTSISGNPKGKPSIKEAPSSSSEIAQVGTPSILRRRELETMKLVHSIGRGI